MGIKSPQWDRDLTSDHLWRILSVLEAVHDAQNGRVFRETLAETIARLFSIRRVTFFFGPTYQTMFEDSSPQLIGVPDAQFREYQEWGHEYDIFRLPQAHKLLAHKGFVRLDDLTELPEPQQRYVGELLAPGGMGPASALHLKFSDGEAIVGMFDESRTWEGEDLLAMRLLARHLRGVSRRVAVGVEDGQCEFEDIVSLLSPRELEVAELISQGLTNAMIAKHMHVTEMTVKKYVSRIFDATGIGNRTMLAVAMLRHRR